MQFFAKKVGSVVLNPKHAAGRGIGTDAMKLSEKTKSVETIFEGKIIRVHKDIAVLQNGREATREVVEHPGGVCIAAVDSNRNIFLVDQFRYPMGEVVTELPAGKLEWGEDPDSAAERELKEETGFTADSIKCLGVTYPSPGFSAEKLYLYLATGLHEGEMNLDEDEFLNCYKTPLSEAVKMVEDNRIKDGKSVSLILLADKLVK